MTPLPELLNGESLINPIEVLKHEVNLTPRKGVGGVEYIEKEFSVYPHRRSYNKWVTHI